MNRFSHKSILISAFILSAMTVEMKAQSVADYTAKWYPEVAGSDMESRINKMQFNDKSQFLFMVSNDETKLYVDLIVADRASVQKIMRYGLTTWFNTNAKHKKELGIVFPVAPDGMGEPPYAKDKGGERKDMRFAMMAGKNKEMDLIGFDGKKEKRTIDPQKDNDFQGNIEMQEGGKLYIRLVLPLAKLSRGSLEALSLPISLGFETGYMDLTGQSQMPSGGGTQGGGGMHGGGMYGGGPPPGAGQGSMTGTQDQQQRPDINQMASPTRLWIKKINFAAKP